MAKRSNIPESTKYRLIAIAAGRCEFPGCNKLLSKDGLTKQEGNFSNFAHIIPVAENGPRKEDRDKIMFDDINSIENLMLLCLEHHKLIDAEPVPEEYSARKLLSFKKEHEERIAALTDIQKEHKTYIVCYRVSINEQDVSISVSDAKKAMLPLYPAEQRELDISPEVSRKEHDELWYEDAVNDLCAKYNESIRRRLKENTSARFAIFALAPMPLLIKLGSLIDDKHDAVVFQKQRDNRAQRGVETAWKWDEHASPRQFFIGRPSREVKKSKPVLLLLLSTGEINTESITEVLGNDISIWRITSDYHGYDVIKNRDHLIEFKAAARIVLEEILKEYHKNELVHVFPIMPTSACVEFGRIRVAAHNPWQIYERRQDVNGKFVKTILIK